MNGESFLYKVPADQQKTLRVLHLSESPHDRKTDVRIHIFPSKVRQGAAECG